MPPQDGGAAASEDTIMLMDVDAAAREGSRDAFAVGHAARLQKRARSGLGGSPSPSPQNTPVASPVAADKDDEVKRVCCGAVCTSSPSRALTQPCVHTCTQDLPSTSMAKRRVDNDRREMSALAASFDPSLEPPPARGATGCPGEPAERAAWRESMPLEDAEEGGVGASGGERAMLLSTDGDDGVGAGDGGSAAGAGIGLGFGGLFLRTPTLNSAVER